MKKFFKEFKAFITKGNILDMAVGVIIGGAFNAIVTALVSILMSISTWGVPGGLKGLVTVLPAATDAQKGMEGIGQYFQASELQSYATMVAEQNYAAQIASNPDYLLTNPNLIESAKTTILGKYTLHGSTYTYNLSAVIDWGTFINAIISFLIVALTLFVIVKVVKYSAAKRAMLADVESRAVEKESKGLPLTKKEKAALEAKAQREAEEKAAAEAAANAEPVVDPVVALLEDIRDSLKANPKTKND